MNILWTALCCHNTDIISIWKEIIINYLLDWPFHHDAQCINIANRASLVLLIIITSSALSWFLIQTELESSILALKLLILEVETLTIFSSDLHFLILLFLSTSSSSIVHFEWRMVAWISHSFNFSVDYLNLAENFHKLRFNKHQSKVFILR